MIPTTRAEKQVIAQRMYTPGSKKEKNLQLPYNLLTVKIVAVQN
jgi:hypothetical protein